jgi:hypothetical protein
MTKSLGNTLPQNLLSRLSTTQLSQIEKRVILLTTVDLDGWPRYAMLSHFEVVARSASSILMLTFSKSKTTDNLKRNGHALLLFVDEEMSYYVRMICSKLDGVNVGSAVEILFSCKVEDVSEDKVSSAKILSGITFSGHDPGMPRDERARVRAKLLDYAASHSS